MNFLSAHQEGVLRLACRNGVLYEIGNRMDNASIKPSEAFNAHRAEIRDIVAAHRASNARVFGSVTRGNDTDESDIEILIDPPPATTLMDIEAIRFKLSELLGFNVDVLTPNALPDSFRARVEAEAKPV